MTNKVQRILMFLFGCMVARFALVYIAYILPTKYLPYMGAVAFVIASGFALIYINGWRKTGAETGGQPIWWDFLRPVHAALWFTFAIMAVMKDRRAWIILLTDTIIGLVAFTIHHIRN